MNAFNFGLMMQKIAVGPPAKPVDQQPFPMESVRSRMLGLNPRTYAHLPNLPKIGPDSSDADIHGFATGLAGAKPFGGSRGGFNPMQREFNTAASFAKNTLGNKRYATPTFPAPAQPQPAQAPPVPPVVPPQQPPQQPPPPADIPASYSTYGGPLRPGYMRDDQNKVRQFGKDYADLLRRQGNRPVQ
jgi:hypothetical protein